jgi:hypothetical protein
MTPLAYELLKDLTTPGAFRMWDFAEVIPGASGSDITNNLLMAKALGYVGDRSDFWRAVNECHFFDLSAVSDHASVVGASMRDHFNNRGHFSRRLAFLPAQNSWLEFEESYTSVHDGTLGKFRQAYLLFGESDSRHRAVVATISRNPGGEWAYVRQAPIPLVEADEQPVRCMEDHPELELRRGQAPHSIFLLYGALALINTPRIIGRRQHMPHERVEREKLKALKLVGKFPLRVWTEIILKVAPPDDRTGEPATEGHLTGEKCLHFVRTFLRVRMGQLEYVESHWRGNPALGMKRSRYRVEEGDSHA